VRVIVPLAGAINAPSGASPLRHAAEHKRLGNHFHRPRTGCAGGIVAALVRVPSKDVHTLGSCRSAITCFLRCAAPYDTLKSSRRRHLPRLRTGRWSLRICRSSLVNEADRASPRIGRRAAYPSSASRDFCCISGPSCVSSWPASDILHLQFPAAPGGAHRCHRRHTHIAFASGAVGPWAICAPAASGRSGSGAPDATADPATLTAIGQSACLGRRIRHWIGVVRQAARRSLHCQAAPDISAIQIRPSCISNVAHGGLGGRPISSA